MIDIEKFLVSLRSNKDLDGKLKPIYLADTVQEEIKIIQAAVENSLVSQKWVGLTDEEFKYFKFYAPWEIVWQIENKLKEKNGG